MMSVESHVRKPFLVKDFNTDAKSLYPGGLLNANGGEFSAFKIKNKIKSNLRFFIRYARPIHWLTIPWFVLGRGILFALKKLTG